LTCGALTLSKNESPRIVEKRCAKIFSEEDVSRARALLRQMLERTDVRDDVLEAQLLTMIDELSKNILRHGGEGMICVKAVRTSDHIGFGITAEDRGSGISDLDLAFSPGYSEDRGMGMGLNLLRALADDMRVANLLSGGAFIEVWKWI